MSDDRPQGGGGKRRNQNGQQRREEAEAEDDEVVEAGTFKRASQDKLRKRRIISVSGRFGSKSSTPAMQAPPALAAQPTATVAVRPSQQYVAMEGIGAGAKGQGIFANVNLKPPEPAPGASAPGLSFPKANPFAGFVSAPAPKATAFPGFGSSAPAAGASGGERASALLPAGFGAGIQSGFGGGSSFLASPTSTPAPMAETPVAPQRGDKLEVCNKAFLKWVRRQARDKPATPWTAGVKDYLAYVAKLEPAAPAPVAKPFAFVAPAPAAAKPAPAFNFGAAFNFGGAPAPAPAGGFKFGASVGAPKAAPAAAEDEMPKEDRVAVSKVENADETTAFESRCSLRRYDKPEGEKPQWRDLGKGQLRVTRHKVTQAACVVVRNDVGKVVLNFALSEKMTCRKTKAGVTVVAMTAEGMKQYLLRTREPLEAAHLAPAKLE